nr:phosphoribosylformylglycinamidine synthase subunit PurS [Gemmatimonadota bacterium]
MQFRVEIRITPRVGILDPQGKAVGGALASLGFTGLGDVHVGRFIALEL